MFIRYQVVTLLASFIVSFSVTSFGYHKVMAYVRPFSQVFFLHSCLCNVFVFVFVFAFA